MQSTTHLTHHDTPHFQNLQGVFNPIEWSIIREGREADARHAELIARTVKTVNFEFQGGLVKVSGHKVKSLRKRSTATRGLCLDFSRRSRLNLLEKFARLDWKNHKAVFLTLTYHNQIPDEQTGKAHLRAFLKRLWRECGQCATVWRMEYQPKRGALHFHLILFDMPYLHWHKILGMWQAVTKDPTITQTRINLLDSPTKAQRYVAKYVSKPSETRSGYTPEDYLNALCLVLVLGLLDTLPYLAANEKENTPGRFWGIEQRSLLPYAELTVIAVLDRLDLLHSMKRAMRHVYKRTNGVRFCGARLFTVNANRWLEWLEFTVVVQ